MSQILMNNCKANCTDSERERGDFILKSVIEKETWFLGVGFDKLI